MKAARKMATVLLLLAVSVILFQTTGIDVQAATKTHTYVQDKKSGVGYPTAVRVQTQSTYQDFSVYLKNKGDYVAKVTTNSSNLIAKLTYQQKLKEESSGYQTSYFEGVSFKGDAEITCFAKEAGTYQVTFVVKNAKNKQIAKKTVKVFAGSFTALEKVTFNGKDITYSTAPSNNLSKKAKGKLVVKTGKDFVVKKIQAGGYKADGSVDYKTVKNKSTITLSTVKAFKKKNSSYQSTYSSYESGTNYDYIYPATLVKITIYDKKLKTTYDIEKTIYKQ